MPVDSIHAAVQAACLPGVWSRGAALSRGQAVHLESETPEEIRLRIIEPNRPLSPRVSLWPGQVEDSDPEWFCDCGDRNDPCVHAAAAVIALKAGTARKIGGEARGPEEAGSPPARASALGRVVYRFEREPASRSLELGRFVARAGAEEPLTTTLVSRIGGLSSGRVSGAAVSATREDFAADAAIEPGKRRPDRAALATLFRALDGIDGATLDGAPVGISGKALGLQASLADDGEGFRLRIGLEPAATETFANGAALCGNILRPVSVPALSQEEREAFRPEGRLYSRGEASELAARVLPALQAKLPLRLETSRLPTVLELKPRLLLRTEEHAGELVATPVLVYGEPALAEVLDASGELFSLDPAHAVIRDIAAERELESSLRQALNLQLGRPVRLTPNEAALFLREAPTRCPGLEVSGKGASAFTARGVLVPELRVLQPDGASPELGFDLRFALGEAGADPARVMQAWRRGEDGVPLLGGGWAALPRDWLDRHGPAIVQLLEAREAAREAGRSGLPPHCKPVLIDLAEEAGARLSDQLQRWKEAIRNHEKIPHARLPDGLKAELRPYQRQGVDWLGFLRGSGLGALLADDMGLGKTLQTICLLEGQALIVAPTSVLTSWTEQLERFRPGLDVNLYWGTRRQLADKPAVTLTSYAILRLDAEALQARQWDTVVLDEAQTIRNPESQAAQAAFALRAVFRIALSGTPLENRLEDLWSQMRFLNPGLLGERSEFQERYGRSERIAELRRRIQPFILRRLKRDVAPELPPRTETTLYCELDTDERGLYQTILGSARAEVSRLLEAGGSVLGALEAILRLRQACCHRALVPGHEAQSSSKTELLLEQLETSCAEGHRSLVFSQWTSFLDLIEPGLKSRGIEFLRLDGTTRDRTRIVQAFQDPAGPPVLLLSLKAGGVGLTLTAADHVFLLDPWWNPATEDQAADRAHRIGQENPVQIHRLMARDTIEERVIALQQNKRALSQGVLEGADGAAGITREELLELLG